MTKCVLIQGVKEKQAKQNANKINYVMKGPTNENVHYTTTN